jgi:hypothetical protein
MNLEYLVLAALNDISECRSWLTLETPSMVPHVKLENTGEPENKKNSYLFDVWF